MLRKYASKILGLKFARKNPLVYNWYNQEIKLASSRLCSTYQLADIISKYLPDGSSKKEKRTRPSKTQKAKNYPTGSYYKTDESILDVICKRTINRSGDILGLVVNLPSENEFDKVIPIENLSREEESRILPIVYGLQQALNVTKTYPTKYKQITLYMEIKSFEKTDSRNKYLLEFKDSYKKEIDDLIDNLKPIAVTFEHQKFHNKSSINQTKTIMKAELQKICENESDHVKEIDDESILKVICKKIFDKFNKRMVLVVNLPSENEFDEVIPIENLPTEKESKILRIVYGLQQALKVTKTYPTKYKQVSLYIGNKDFVNTDSRNKYLQKFKDSYKKEIDDLINNLKPIDVTFKNRKILKQQAKKAIKTKLQKTDLNDLQDESIQKEIYGVKNNNILNKQSSREIDINSQNIEKPRTDISFYMSSPSTLKVFCESNVFLNEKTETMKNLGFGVYIPDHDNKFNLSRAQKIVDIGICLNEAHIKAVYFGLEQALSVTENYPNKYEKILIFSNFSNSEITSIVSSIENKGESKVIDSEINKKLISLVKKLDNVEIIWKHKEILCEDESAVRYMNEAYKISYNASIEAV